MKQYIYKASAACLNAWPSGEFRLSDIQITENPDEADVFVVPGSLTGLFPTRESLYKLPYFRGRESKHALFDCSDNTQLYDLPCMFIRCNTRPWFLKRDENTVSWSWPVECYAECIEVPGGKFLHDISFQGWVTSHESRRRSVDSCIASGLKFDVATYTDFTGYIFDQPEGIRRRAEFRRSMRESRICLCPESIDGVFPYRYFESMSAGRVPLLVGSEFVFPFESEVDYAAFTLFCSREDAGRAGQVAGDFISSHSDEDLIEIGKLARHAWVSWLDSRRWPKLHAYAVQKKLGVLQSA